MIKIAIDAGHGPDTPGKRCPDDSMREFAFNSTVAKYVRELLAGYKDVAVLFTHDASGTRDVPLKERTNKANSWCADALVSIHANAMGDGWGGAQGIETFVYQLSAANQAAVTLAGRIQRALVAATGRKDRGVKAGDLHMVRETRMPSILIECGFMTNKDEAALLKSDAYRRKCAGAIVAGLAECFSLRKEDEPTKKEETVKVIVNGKEIGTGYVDAGVTYVPVRAVSEALGASVDYDGKAKIVTIKGGK